MPYKYWDSPYLPIREN